MSNPNWCATDEGAIAVDVTFKLATAVTDDGEGGSADGTSDIVIPVRLVPIQRLGDVAGINEQTFPGSPTYSYVFNGWVNDSTDYLFPDSLRHQGRVIGAATLQNRPGRIECSIGAFPIKEAAEMIGEKFTAGWVPS